MSCNDINHKKRKQLTNEINYYRNDKNRIIVEEYNTIYEIDMKCKSKLKK